MLTLQQSNEYNRLKKLDDFLTVNAPVYAAFAPFVTEVQDFDLHFQQLDALIPNKNIVSSGITTNKTTLKHEIATALALVCRKTMAFANRSNMPELAAETNTREDTIFRTKDANLLAYAQHMQNLLTPLLTDESYIPYGVTDVKLSDIVTKATAFNGMIGKADQKLSGNTTANTAINAQLKKLHDNIAQLDLLVDEFTATNPEFVQGYHINSSLDNIGIRHSGIEGMVRTKSGDPLADATVKLLGTDKTAATDLKGFYRLERITPDDYQVEAAAGGYTTQTKLQHISRGRIEELNFDL